MFDPVRNPRRARSLVLALWAIPSAASVALALGRDPGRLHASLTLQAVAQAGGQRVLAVQNDGDTTWHRARLWLDDRYYAEALEIIPGTAWRLTHGDLLDLKVAPLALADPFYLDVADTPLQRRAPPSLTHTRARLEVGGEILELLMPPVTNAPTP